jgi:3-hydroxybutyrate dehydrogenase
MTQLALSHFLSAHSPDVDGDADAGGGGGKPSYPRNTKAIVHVSSIAGQATPLNAPLYNASKHGINGLVRSLAPLERRVGVRVVAVAPGVVKTPLWTEDAGKLRAIDEGVDEWVTPEEVAAVMLALVERDEIASGEGKEMIGIKGGSILEVSKGRVRDVKAFDDPGPVGRPGNTAGAMGKLEDEVWETLGREGWGSVP